MAVNKSNDAIRCRMLAYLAGMLFSHTTPLNATQSDFVGGSNLVKVPLGNGIPRQGLACRGKGRRTFAAAKRHNSVEAEKNPASVSGASGR
ncbi:MAG TPA: hypothetical protein VJ652_07335 [Noviherbaspirillum sp.]|nr:hypothetical protein [Noviherbaspirillum sp.]